MGGNHGQRLEGGPLTLVQGPAGAEDEGGRHGAHHVLAEALPDQAVHHHPVLGDHEAAADAGDVGQALDQQTEDASRTRKVLHDTQEALASASVVYGVTTGFGNFADVHIPLDRLRELQLNLLRSHADGVGAPLEEAETRALMLLRANVLAKGFSGVRLESYMFTEQSFRAVRDVLKPDGVLAVLIGQTHLPEVYRLLDGDRDAVFYTIALSCWLIPETLVVGAILTFTGIGAAVGIPLMVAGAATIAGWPHAPCGWMSASCACAWDPWRSAAAIHRRAAA